MTAVADVDTSLASKCMDFCQALANQGQAFNFFLTTASGFSFSLDTRKKAANPDAKKRSSPSTQRRNAKRREEYMKRKQNHSTVNPIVEEVNVASNVPCDQCDFKSVSEKGLWQHKRIKHGPPQLSSSSGQPKSPTATPESLRRQQPKEASLHASPMLDVSREECNLSTSEAVEEIVGLCKNCGAELRIIRGYWCCESTKQLCNDCGYDLGVCNS